MGMSTRDGKIMTKTNDERNTETTTPMLDVRFSDDPDDTGTHGAHTVDNGSHADTVDNGNIVDGVDNARSGAHVYTPGIPYGAMREDVETFMREHPNAEGGYYARLSDEWLKQHDGSSDTDASATQAVPVVDLPFDDSSSDETGVDDGERDYVPSGDNDDTDDGTGMVVPTGVDGTPEFMPIPLPGIPDAKQRRAGQHYGDGEPVPVKKSKSFSRWNHKWDTGDDGNAAEKKASGAGTPDDNGNNAESGDDGGKKKGKRKHVIIDALLNVLIVLGIIAFIVTMFMQGSSGKHIVVEDSTAWTTATKQANDVMDRVDKAQSSEYDMTIGTEWFNGNEWLVLKNSDGITVDKWKAESIDGMKPTYRLTMMADGSYKLQYALGTMDGEMDTKAPATIPTAGSDQNDNNDSQKGTDDENQ